MGTIVQQPAFPFPATVAHLRDMSTKDIKTLAVAFNENFGLSMGDNVARMQGKLEAFIRL